MNEALISDSMGLIARSQSVDDVSSKVQSIQMLQSLMRNFLSDPCDLRCSSSERAQFMVQHCIRRAVMAADSYESLTQDRILDTLFSELCNDTQAASYVRWLFKDLIETKFQFEKLLESSIKAESRQTQVIDKRKQAFAQFQQRKVNTTTLPKGHSFEDDQDSSSSGDSIEELRQNHI